MKIQNTLDWLLIFFIHEIPEYTYYSEQLLNTISTSNLYGTNEIWVILDKIERQSTTETAIFRPKVLQLQLTVSGITLIEVPLSKLGINNSSKDTWKEVLTFLYSNRLSQRKMLFTWSHGAGFGFNAEDPDAFLPVNKFGFRTKQDTSNESIISEVVYPYYYLSNEEVQKLEFKDFRPELRPIKLKAGEYQIIKKNDTFDCKKLEVLWMSDLADVLRNALQGQKIDLLIMMNCNMQLFENGYMLKDVVQYLVGPESQMWVHGYAYKELLTLLQENSNISNEEICRQIIVDYISMHERLGNQNYLNNTTLFANSLQEFNTLTSVFESITKSLRYRLPDVKSTINDLRQKKFYSVSGQNGFFLLDTKLWIDTVFSNSILMPEGSDLYREFLSSFQSVTTAMHVGLEFRESDATEQKKYGHSGCSLFFPTDNRFNQPRRFSWCQYFSGQLDSPFQRDTEWDEFINDLNVS